MVRRHLLDAAHIPDGTIELLRLAVEHAIADNTFRPGGYRAGEVTSHHLRKLIEAILVVNVETASGSARFANGDWSRIDLIMPMITSLMAAAGWSTFVMSKFLLLCERAGMAYPLDNLIQQVTAALTKLENAKGNWVGTSLPARVAAVVQRLSDANFPLKHNQAQGLLRILDILIDLGDRRSAALEQTETFKGIQWSVQGLWSSTTY